MADSLLLLSLLAWGIAALLALLRVWPPLGRLFLAAGCLTGIAAALSALPHATEPVRLSGGLMGEAVAFHLSPEALWLLGFGLVPAALATALATPSSKGRHGWNFGAAASLIGALGVLGVQNGAALLIAWELMSLGGALMILSERLGTDGGRNVLFMLALLEVGAVALVIAIALLGLQAGSLDFVRFGDGSSRLAPGLGLFIGLLFLVSFGAKLGLLPFYEWFPAAYGSASGASGALLSGVVLNAAFFALARSLTDWLSPEVGRFPMLAVIVIVIAALSAILTILYAFQQDDWRPLLSFSSAENASIAVTALGAALLFRSYELKDLAGLAWIVALLHLAGHSLAKGCLFLTADGLWRATGSYAVTTKGAGRYWILGIGALLSGMSLSAMPPTAGFVSEWFVFQTVFQGFHIPHLAGRLVLALTGAGLALTAAVAFATFVKVIGIGVLSRKRDPSLSIDLRYSLAVGFLGLAALALGVGMPLWLPALDQSTTGRFGVAAAQAMHNGPILVPLTATFAFISPSLLIVVMPLLALVPIALILVSRRRPVRRAAVWYGGLQAPQEQAATTSLTFSNAMRTFYSFVYRPTADIQRQGDQGGYFVRKLVFEHDVAPIFGPLLFQPSVHAVQRVAATLRTLQSGHLNFYLSLIGILLVVVLGLTLA